jgi:type III pantothenate kinase
MIGAYARMRAQTRGGVARPLVLVMVGTAVTVEALDAQGHFLGGFILPGHGIMLRALESGTAGLRVPTGEVRPFPTNTSDALTSGGTYAIAGAVERMVQHVRQHCGAEPLNIMTGGAGWKMLPSMGITVDLVETLIFDGLLHIAQERNLGQFPE